MRAAGNYVQVKEIGEQGIQTPGNNLKLGEIISGGISALDEVSVNPELRVGYRVLFDTNKSLKHGGFWYLKAESIFAFNDEGN